MIDYATLSMRGGEADGNWRKLAEAEFGQPRPNFCHFGGIFVRFPINAPLSSFQLPPTHVLGAFGSRRKLTEAEFGQPRPCFGHLGHILACFHNNFPISIFHLLSTHVLDVRGIRRKRNLASPALI